MRHHLAVRARLSPPPLHPLLRSFAREAVALSLRIGAYVIALGAMAWGGFNLYSGLDLSVPSGLKNRPTWATADRSAPAFALLDTDSAKKSEIYEVLRHPGGGRKDILRWTPASGTGVAAEIELYRSGEESTQSGPPADDVAARMDPDETREIEAAGLIDSKFGPVTLLAFTPRKVGARSCLGFMKSLDEANLRISGWSCQADTLPELRSAIGCTLDRLMLLNAGNDPKLAELFAKAELKRKPCGTAAAHKSGDWVVGAQNPPLRGSL